MRFWCFMKLHPSSIKCTITKAIQMPKNLNLIFCGSIFRAAIISCFIVEHTAGVKSNHEIRFTDRGPNHDTMTNAWNVLYHSDGIVVIIGAVTRVRHVKNTKYTSNVHTFVTHCARIILAISVSFMKLTRFCHNNYSCFLDLGRWLGQVVYVHNLIFWEHANFVRLRSYRVTRRCLSGNCCR